MWTFLNPLFLWAAAAAVIPLLLHLLQKRRTVKLAFSTLRFLKLAQQRSASRVRLENLLLWLLRTLMLLALAAAFALPVLRSGALGNFLGTAQRDVAIVWDVSYSMGYDSGRVPLWNETRDTLTAIIDGLDSGDRVCVFLANQDVTPLIEQPTSDLDLALSLIKQQAPLPQTSRLRPAIAAAVNALKDSGRRERELYVVTDGQAVPWNDFAEMNTADQPITFFVTLLGAASPQNDAIGSIDVQPPTLLTNTAIKIQAKLLQTGEAGETAVSLVIDDQEIDRRSAQGEVEFNLPPLPQGVHTARLETPSDGLTIDNTFHFLLRVRDQVPVLVVGSEPDSFFLVRALNPRGSQAWQVTRVDPAAALPPNLHEYPAVFLCNALPLPGQLVLDLESYVRGGGVLMIFPGDGAQVADYASWNILPAMPTAIDDATAQRFALRLDQPTDPLFRNIKLPSGTVPSVTIRRALRFGPTPAADDATTAPNPAAPVPTASGSAGTTILTAGESPFLLSRQVGEGRVLLASVSADRRWSDLPLSAFFLPLVHQAVQLRGGAGDQPYRWAAAELNVPFEDANLIAPSGEPVSLRTVKTETGASHYLDNALEPGIYRRGDQPLLAINIRREESNLTPLDKTALPLPTAHVAYDRQELARQVKQHRIGRPFTETLFWLVLVLAILEVFVANRASRPRPTVTENLRINPSGRVLEKAA